MSAPPAYQRRLHWFAISTVLVLMTTLSAGALVTSKNAGMAFRDWPTSDGQPMLSYPWWQDFASNWDKFLEHGHRLAGVLIGCWVIALVGLVNWYEERGWVKGLAFGLLAGVIIQGILGGFRVQLDERGLALVHGFFAACVTALLATTVTVLSMGWFRAAEVFQQVRVGWAKPLAVVLLGLIVAQYLLGGAIRHHHTGLHEHLGLGIVIGLMAIVNAVVSHRTGAGWLRTSGWGLLLAVLVQIALGAGAWIVKWGWAGSGYVATADSISQVAVRSLHMVFGILVFASAVVHTLRVFRVASVSHAEAAAEEYVPVLKTRGGVV
ncbi:MAG: COX15/CtaA family protein [Planctomycetaceae bacterium]